ncbi:outer membrane receptor protein involved in Fe transport [Fulvimonas soli]|jgi:outer membrane receptor protein involved in Fe transport|uniref:Outer membrane receptor protein involved in Fe transport n=3 Tax=Fulvimonas soli TaxID=155197 RepID=A0A316I997_9GAMM|nr:TonB-dependent receptor [Fulvimonas soli]PWK83884.1 outer membrane receptor protein involved in Fe transport [Fulvimonas soli]
MTRRLLAFSLACALGAAPVFATDLASATTDDGGQSASRNKPAQVKQLGTVDVNAALDQARNALSPDTGSSQYVIDQKAIAQLPLGDSTPLNQVILQAPGVVQDSYGGLHVRGDHANLQYRINGVIIPESISGFGQTLDARTIQNVKLLDGALPAQYGLRTAAVVDITTKSGHDLGNGGSVGVTGGSFGTLNPNASLWGGNDRWSYFLTANYLESDVGVENPTSSRKPVHDHTNQVKGFGDISYLIDSDTRLSFLFGVSNSRFQIPNNPGQEPAFGYLDTVDFDSAKLDERQQEKTRFGVLALQGKLGATDYQVSLGQRYSSLDFTPDLVGDLMFNGVASDISRSNRASTLQADFATPLGDSHTLRYGLYGSFERAPSSNDAWVFPADEDGNQTSTTPIEILDGNRITARTWSGYVQDEWSIGDKLTVNYGVRGDVYKAFRTESQLSPRLGAVYQATDSTTLHAGYSRYFTPPATEAITTTNIAKFDGTTNAVSNPGNATPLAERSDYFDAGVQQQLGALTLGLDAYYRKVRRLQDEGQFGAALVYSTFNYAKGRIKGVEFTANYDDGPFSAYFNLAASRAMGTRVITSQYNFDPDDLAYVADHYIFLDHDQAYSSSGGVSYAIGEATRVGADYLFGSGLRKDGDVPNGASLPSYFQLNLSLSHDFSFAGTGKLHTQLAVINALDRTYELRDGSGIGVGAPQFGPRRGYYLTVQKDF